MKVRQLKLGLICFSVLCVGSTLAPVQAQGVSAASPVRVTPEDQEDRARAAMEGSLARQRTSVEAFKAAVAVHYGSWGKTPIVVQNVLAAGIVENEQQSSLESAPASKQNDTSQADRLKSEAELDAAKAFFQTPWPASVPLAMPNVQLLDQSCDPLDGNEIDKLASQAGEKQGIQTELLKSVMRQESGFKPCALSIAGAMGLMQIMPDTAEMLGLDDPFDAPKNVDAGARYLKMMLDRYQGDVKMALGAYNAGPGRVDKAGGVPAIPETLNYISKVLGSMPVSY